MYIYNIYIYTKTSLYRITHIWMKFEPKALPQRSSHISPGPMLQGCRRISIALWRSLRLPTRFWHPTWRKSRWMNWTRTPRIPSFLGFFSLKWEVAVSVLLYKCVHPTTRVYINLPNSSVFPCSRDQSNFEGIFGSLVNRHYIAMAANGIHSGVSEEQQWLEELISYNRAAARTHPRNWTCWFDPVYLYTFDLYVRSWMKLYIYML